MQFRIWLSRTVFESMLIVISILGALGVQDWQVSREVDRLIERSLVSFEIEITQNKNRIEDLYPFHRGLQSLLLEIDTESNPDSAEELRNVLNSFQSAVLLTSAWDTALATGALAQMDYELVFALSLTYSIQEQFRALYNSGLVELLSSNVDDEAIVTRSVRANIRASVEQLQHGSQILEQLIGASELRIVGAEYSIETGCIEFFEDH